MIVVLMLFFFFFFFQAEDGIRDAQESRGLGDVYKRQVHGFSRKIPMQASGSWWGHSWSTSMRYTDFTNSVIYSGWAMPSQYFHWWSNWHVGKEVPDYVMDLTYYRMGDHVMTEEEMKAIYIKGRSTRPTGSNYQEKTGAGRS
eukprot:TRINITY_DN3662_c0_g1_i13.p1 TRINITY_DN3662_c0_g1~~TRINITY_DN3662_c0_g1_i13.p1  ORF type:complete len:143 (+),score=44.33 TRINITY_DN3662_c0_g1_i13:81-509(+)